MKQITDNVFVESNIIACNLGVITTSAGTILIDAPEYPSDALKWRDEVVKMDDLKYIINTEEHPDHFQSCGFFPATLISSRATRDFLAKEPISAVLERLRKSPESVALMEERGIRLADITFDESMSLHLGQTTIDLFSLRGHAPGGIGVYVPDEKVVFTADIVFCQAKTWLHAAAPEQWLASIKKIESLDVDYIVPGHGPVCDKNYLKEQAGVIEGWIELVRSAIGRGMTEEELWADFTCPDPYPKQAGTPMTEDMLNRAIITRLYQLYKE